VLYKVFDELELVQDAHRLLESSTHIGKIVVRASPTDRRTAVPGPEAAADDRPRLAAAGSPSAGGS
jgi:hypothetical protein